MPGGATEGDLAAWLADCAFGSYGHMSLAPDGYGPRNSASLLLRVQPRLQSPICPNWFWRSTGPRGSGRRATNDGKDPERYMTVATFSDVLASLAQDGDQFRVEPSEDWRQGRTLFGGLSACLAVLSAKRAFPELPSLRSAQFTFIGPATGALFLTPSLLRTGKSATFIEVEGRTETNTVLRATLVFGIARRSSRSYNALPMPHASPPGALPKLVREPFAPTFSHQFETQIAGGAPAFSGAAKPGFLAWLRHRDCSAPDDITSIIALGDATPPPALSMFTEFPPISTMTWSIDVLSDEFSGPEWHLVAAESDIISYGYSNQRSVLWETSGSPVFISRQMVAIFG
jgi:acyl-CoA thioesterase